MDVLKQQFGDRLKENESMAKHTNFRIGGPARWFVEATSGEELKEIVEYALQNKLKYFILGGGTNTLVSDEGYDGLVIKMANRSHAIDGDRVTADAGAIMVAVARAAGNAGLTGLEWAVSLPGTIGGAVRGNAGCFGGETRDNLETARVLRCADVSCEIVELSNADLKFDYRDSALKHNSDIVIDATYKLQPGHPDDIKQKMDEVLSKRKTTQPIAPGTAGCAFKNIEYQNDSEVAKLLEVIPETPTSFLEQKRIGCGWVVDRLGFKGATVGGIMVAEEHGNFLMNLGDAKASDVVELIETIKRRAKDDLGLELEEEIEYVGF